MATISGAGEVRVNVVGPVPIAVEIEFIERVIEAAAGEVRREIGAGDFSVEPRVAAADGEAFKKGPEEAEALVVLEFHAADLDALGAVFGGDEFVALELVVTGVTEFLGAEAVGDKEVFHAALGEGGGELADGFEVVGDARGVVIG